MLVKVTTASLGQTRLPRSALSPRPPAPAYTQAPPPRQSPGITARAGT